MRRHLILAAGLALLFTFPAVAEGKPGGASDQDSGDRTANARSRGTLARNVDLHHRVLRPLGTAPEGDGPDLWVTFGGNALDIDEGTTGEIIVGLVRPMDENDPAQVSVDYVVEAGFADAGRDYAEPPSQTLTFVNGGPRILTIPFETLDDIKHEGDERMILRLTNAVGATPGFREQTVVSILDDDPYDPSLMDDFERYPYLWDAGVDVRLDSLEIGAADRRAVPGQGAFEHVLEATVPLRVGIDIQGRLCNPSSSGLFPALQSTIRTFLATTLDPAIYVVLRTTETFDATTVDHTTVTLGEAYETHVQKKTGIPRRHEEDVDGDGDLDLVFHFKFEETGLPCNPDVVPFNGRTYDGMPVTAGGAVVAFGRDFAIGRDWSTFDGLEFWFYGQNSGDGVTVELRDNRAPDPGPSGWEMVWADEFNEPAGTPPDPAHWAYEIGDGRINGIPGWGNAEREYYTDSTDNVATDGLGNLVITAREADGSLLCYYGPCEYTSARLISWHKAEFAYGRIESRILLPDGLNGLWPAFWSLGTNIGQVGWPQTGEIDVMEYVSRRPYEMFGTIHGPGYSGGASYSKRYVTYPERIAADYHTFAIEWQPDRIEWYVDGFRYHTATPGDVAPNEWVFNDPVFLIFNLATGGYFGGAVSPDTTFPQSMAIDYVRVYQWPDTAERWEAVFTDNFVGWQEIDISFGEFARGTEQPAGAPDDGLNLDQVWGYGFRLPDGGSETGHLLLDQVRVQTAR